MTKDENYVFLCYIQLWSACLATTQYLSVVFLIYMMHCFYFNDQSDRQFNFTTAAAHPGLMSKCTRILYLCVIFSVERPAVTAVLPIVVWSELVCPKIPPKVPRERGASAPGAVSRHRLTSSQTFKHVKWWNATGGENKIARCQRENLLTILWTKATSPRILKPSKSRP